MTGCGLIQFKYGKKGHIYTFHCTLKRVSFSRIDAVNQLKTKLCSLHVPVQEQKNDILDIIEYEKQGQSPSIVVVIDVIDYLALDPSLNEMQYLTTR